MSGIVDRLKINSIAALAKLPLPVGQRWIIWTYLLNSEIVRKDGTADNNYGTIIQLGSYSTQKEAEEKVEDFIEITGHQHICCSKLGMFVKLEVSPDPRNIKIVNEKELQNNVNKENERRARNDKRRDAINKDIAKDRLLEQDPNTQEYFNMNLIAYMSNSDKIDFYAKKLEELMTARDQRFAKIIDHNDQYPEHIDQFLPSLQEKFSLRGEEGHFSRYEEQFKKYKAQFLPAKPKTIESDEPIMDDIVEIEQKVENTLKHEEDSRTLIPSKVIEFNLPVDIPEPIKIMESPNVSHRSQIVIPTIKSDINQRLFEIPVNSEAELGLIMREIINRTPTETGNTFEPDLVQKTEINLDEIVSTVLVGAVEEVSTIEAAESIIQIQEINLAPNVIETEIVDDSQ